jgi:hypothetical protein
MTPPNARIRDFDQTHAEADLGGGCHRSLAQKRWHYGIRSKVEDLSISTF